MKSNFSKTEKRALNLLFLPFGIGAMATATRFPEIRDNLGISNGLFGTYLTLGGIGALLAFIFVGNLVHKFGIKPIISLASSGLFLSMAVVPHFRSSFYWLILNILIGFFWASFLIANNGQAIHRQQEVGELILPKLHGLWSLGALITSIFAIIITPFVTLAWHIGILMLAMWLLTMYGIQKSTPYFIDKSDEDDAVPNITLSGLVVAFKSQPLVATAMILAMQIEFSTQDWSAIYVKDSIGMSAATSIYGYTFFIAAMIILRLNMNRALRIFSEHQLLNYLPKIGGAGFIICISGATYFSETNQKLGFTLALVGFAFAGFGSSIIVPTLYGIAFRRSSLPSSVVVAQLGFVTSIIAFFTKIGISWVVEISSVTVGLMIPGLMLVATAKFANLGQESKVK